MYLPGHQLIKKLAVERELSLSTVTQIIGKKFDDHRDFYVLSTLYSEGFIGANIPNGDPFTHSDDHLAKMFYAMSLKKGDVESDGLAPIHGTGMKNTLIIHCTAKADMYLAEIRKSIFLQGSALGIGVAVAWVSFCIAQIV